MSKERISFTKRASNDPTLIERTDIIHLRSMFLEIKDFECDKIIKDIISAYVSGSKKILSFARSIGETLYSRDAYEKYLAYRAANPTDTASRTYLEARLGCPKAAEAEINRRISIRANPYDPEYIAQRDHISIEEARFSIARYKSQKATSLSGFIARHGEIAGRLLFQRFQETSKAPHMRGTIEEQSQRARERSKASIEFWLKRGFTIEEARSEVSRHQRSTAGIHREFWAAKGLSDDEIDTIMASIYARKDGVSLKAIKRRHPHLTEDQAVALHKEMGARKSRPQTADILMKARSTMEKKGIWVPRDRLSEYEQYKREVWDITRRQDINQLPGADKRGRAGVPNATHLDHRFSIRRGFLEGIPPSKIGHISNLEFLPWQENVRKQSSCSLTRDALILMEDKDEN